MIHVISSDIWVLQFLRRKRDCEIVKIRSLQKLLYIYGRKQYIFPQHSAMINLSRQCHTDRVTPLDLPAHVYFDGECLCHYVLHEAQHCLPKTEQELPVINLDIVSKY